MKKHQNALLGANRPKKLPEAYIYIHEMEGSFLSSRTVLFALSGPMASECLQNMQYFGTFESQNRKILKIQFSRFTKKSKVRF